MSIDSGVSGVANYLLAHLAAVFVSFPCMRLHTLQTAAAVPAVIVWGAEQAAHSISTIAIITTMSFFILAHNCNENNHYNDESKEEQADQNPQEHDEAVAEGVTAVVLTLNHSHAIVATKRTVSLAVVVWKIIEIGEVIWVLLPLQEVLLVIKLLALSEITHSCGRSRIGQFWHSHVYAILIAILRHPLIWVGRFDLGLERPLIHIAQDVVWFLKFKVRGSINAILSCYYGLRWTRHQGLSILICLNRLLYITHL